MKGSLDLVSVSVHDVPRHLGRLDVVIVSYNTGNLLRDCLRSVDAGRGNLQLRVIVVDNASPDGSADLVRREFPWVELIALDENIGYGPANNVGLRRVLAESATPADAILLLNPDTLLPADALPRLMAYLSAHPQAGIIGPKLVRPDGSFDFACRRSFPTPEVAFYRLIGLSKLFPRSPRFGRYNLTYLDPDVETEVDAIVGACMLIRREALVAAGLFDETFFMYGEDLDLCFRIKQLGWRAIYVPSVQIIHYKGAASKTNIARANYEFYRAMWLFHQKHYASRSPFWLNGLIRLGVLILGGKAMIQNMLRPPDRKRVGSAGG